MRGKWHILLFAAALASGAFGAYCHQRAQALSAEAELEQQRSVSAGASFVDTFSGEFVDTQLGQLDHRRTLISRASHWREGMLFSLLGVVFLAFAGYTVRSVETLVDDGVGPMAVPAPQRG